MAISDVISEHKYYVINKDTPGHVAGAILWNDLKGLGGSYKAISDMWDTGAMNDCKSKVGYDPHLVENSPDWYRRVYLVGGKFVNQDQAIKAIADLVEDGPEG